MLTCLIRSYDSCLPDSKRFILNRLQYRIILSDSFSTTYDCERGRQGWYGGRFINSMWSERNDKNDTIGPFIRGKIRRVLHRTRKTRTFRINGTFRLKEDAA